MINRTDKKNVAVEVKTGEVAAYRIGKKRSSSGVTDAPTATWW